MKGIKAEHPFEKYTLYVVMHKREGRRMANLVYSKKDRRTISYAKYLMCVKLGRILSYDETVDHINNDKLDDRIENLQVLSRADNIRKSAKQTVILELVCPICKNTFTFKKRNLSSRPNPTCSRKCGGKKSHISDRANIGSGS